jgi:hypothetical protein
MVDSLIDGEPADVTSNSHAAAVSQRLSGCGGSAAHVKCRRRHVIRERRHVIRSAGIIGAPRERRACDTRDAVGGTLFVRRAGEWFFTMTESARFRFSAPDCETVLRLPPHWHTLGAAQLRLDLDGPLPANARGDVLMSKIRACPPR